MVLLRLGFIVLVEFGFCNLVACDVNGSVSVCEFRYCLWEYGSIFGVVVESV